MVLEYGFARQRTHCEEKKYKAIRDCVERTLDDCSKKGNAQDE